jgi:hypothetical protein
MLARIASGCVVALHGDEYIMMRSMLSAFSMMLDSNVRDDMPVMQEAYDGKGSDCNPASMPGATSAAAPVLQHLSKKPGAR